MSITVDVVKVTELGVQLPKLLKKEKPDCNSWPPGSRHGGHNVTTCRLLEMHACYMSRISSDMLSLTFVERDKIRTPLRIFDMARVAMLSTCHKMISLIS